MGNCTGRSLGAASLLKNPSAETTAEQHQQQQQPQDDADAPPPAWKAPLGTPHPSQSKGSPFKESPEEALSPVPGGSVKVPSAPLKLALGAGCYWGTEKFMARTFQKQPNLPEGKILSGKVGFLGPKSAPANPSYEDVCTGKTGHVEVYHFEYSGGVDFLEQMIRYFFSFHDPTTFQRQGNDQGVQYSSVIYCYTKEQAEVANRIKNELQALINSGAAKKLYSSVRVTTEVRIVEAPFYPAHEAHQDYLTKNVGGYCNHSAREIRWKGGDN